MADFIPAGDDARKTWATTFRDSLDTRGPTVGLTAAQITTLKALCDAIIGRIDAKAAAKAAWLAAVAAAQTGNAADFDDLRKAIAAMKTNPGYTEEIGQALGIVGTSEAFDPNTYVAELREVILSAPVQVTVTFGKAKGKIDGVNVYARRQGTSPWNFLGRDTQSPYVDTTPLAAAGTPEIREYRIRGVIDDVEIGDYSPTRQITVS